VVEAFGQQVPLVMGEAVRSGDPAGARRGVSVRTGVAVALPDALARLVIVPGVLFGFIDEGKPLADVVLNL